jgi:DNA-binding transcriptional ArsR family regulator
LEKLLRFGVGVSKYLHSSTEIIIVLQSKVHNGSDGNNFSLMGGVSMNRLLWYMFAGTRGGYTRGLILKHLTDKPYNADQLAEALNIDYKTIRRHLDVLVKNGIITIEGGRYDKIYFLSQAMDANLNQFNQIWEKISFD